MSKYKVSPFVFKLIKEIENYKQKNEGNSWRSAELMVSHLQSTVKELSRSKHHPLKKAIEEGICDLYLFIYFPAISIIMADQVMQDLNVNDQDGEDFSMEGAMEQARESNTLNSLLTQSYATNNATKIQEIAKRKTEESINSEKKISKRQRTEKKAYVCESTTISYADLGGIDGCINVNNSSHANPDTFRTLGN